MSILGFPSTQELTSMLGYVTDQDRAEWEQRKAASDQQLEAARNGLTARGLASQSAAPALSMAEKSIDRQLQGETIAARQAERTGRKERVERTETRTRFYEEDLPEGADGRQPGF
jgi:hypothetical protein